MVDLPFHGTIGAGATVKIASGKINYPFKVVKAEMTFTEEANNLVQHGWYTQTNPEVTGTGVPSGVNIFGRESPVAFFAGKGTVKKIDTNIEYGQSGLYIILYTFNGCTYAYYIDASITIMQL